MKTFLCVHPAIHRPSCASTIERLEPRIAPAVVVNANNPRIATYTDVDGDLVTITVNRGDLNNATFVTTAAGTLGGEQLNTVDLTHADFAGAKFTTKAVPQAGKGDGFAAVGAIVAPGRDLAAITIDGDLGALTIGDGVTSTPGVGVLKVHSLGAYDITTQEPGGNLTISITGPVNTFMVKTNITNSFIEITGLSPADRALTKFTVGGSILGGAANDSGRLEVAGTIGSILIGGSLVGESGDHSGTIFASGRFGAVTIRGSVIGGAGNNNDPGEEGQIRSTFGFGKIAIAGDLIGGSGSRTGFIFGGSDLGLSFLPEVTSGTVTIGGSVVAASLTGTSGTIATNGNLGRITIGKGYYALEGSVSVMASGGTMAGLTIGGSVIAEPGATMVLFARVLGPMKIGGDVASTSTGVINIAASGNDVSSPALTDAQANALATAIKSVTIRGSVVGVNIVAGAALASPDIAPDVKIGPVKVGGDWVRSNLSVGVDDGADNLFGTEDDIIGSGGGRAGVIASIASVTIGGQAFGTPLNVADHFGIVAQAIGKVRVGGTLLPLLAGAGNDRGADAKHLGTTSDLTVIEVL